MDIDPALTDVEAAAHERLGSADLEHEDLLAVSHLHRYELAAALCEGARVLDLCCGTGYGARILADRALTVHGVDVAAEAIDAARAESGSREGLTFEQADALTYLRALGADRFDAIVCFEGVEHVPAPDALLDELARLRGGGARLLLSLPNSRGFEEDNEFHVTDFGYEEMQAAAERIGGAAIVEQHLAEASVLRRAGDSGEIELRGRLQTPGEDEGAWANHWLLLAGVDDAALASASARLSASAAQNQNGYMKLLERANADLVRHNARLSRTWLGLHDAAAAAMVRRLQEAEARADFAESEAERWEEIADNNDWARQERENELRGLEARLAGPRYAAMDAVYYRLTAFKTGKRLLDGIGSLARRAKR